MASPRLRLFRSTAVRFAALLFAAQIAISGGVLLFVQQTSQRAIAADQRAAVADLRGELLAAYRVGGRGALSALIADRLERAHDELAVILLIGADGRRLAGNLDAWPPVIPPRTGWREIDLYRSGGERPERLGLMATMLPGGEYLLTGHVLSVSRRLTAINAEAMVAALALSVPVALILSILLGRMLGQRIAAIAGTATAVSAGQLSRRVPLNGSGDAFDALGGAVNAMLDRIEALVAELRMVTDGLAHDLRSPVTRLKAVLEGAIARAADPGSLAALERASAEADSLLAMLSTALAISRAEAGIGRERFAPVDAAALLDDLAEVYGPLAEERGFQLAVAAPPGLVLPMDRDLMSQAIGNLIENALNYATDGTRIVLGAARNGEGVAISVADDGPGIPPQRRAEAMRRFGRLDPARRLSGSGLGLSLVEAVAGMHGGTVRLEDNAPGQTPGLKVVLAFPRGADI